MVQTHRPVMTHRRLLLFKWLMVLVPPVTVAVGHSLWLMVFMPAHTVAVGHNLLGYSVGGLAETLLVTLLVTFLALVLAYIFAETQFRVLRRLQAEALAREQDILTMNAVMQERERLSRELHDGVAQLVADLLLRLDTIKELVEADRQQEAEAELERLHGVANEIYEDIGESITGLRTNVTERGLVRALQDYVDQFEERHQIPTSLQILTGPAPDAADRLSPLAALQLFRLIQEALTNVRKHAGAREATVTLISDRSGQLKVVIADDGQGFIPGAQGNGKARPLGLTSMRERVEALGGTFEVNSQPGSGTQVTATIPIPRTRRENGHAALTTPPG
ncbi:MAG: sensor histidine kinase [Ardenticatenaceae bacterium]|nr:sensor histidine kinase [Ardenticatenaceae bacterium]